MAGPLNPVLNTNSSPPQPQKQQQPGKTAKKGKKTRTTRAQAPAQTVTNQAWVEKENANPTSVVAGGLEVEDGGDELFVRQKTTKDCILWSDPPYLHHTDTTPTKTEETTPSRRAPGPDNGGLDDGDNGSLKAMDACRKLAPLLFPDGLVPESKMKSTPVSIKSRIAKLKKKYYEFRKLLGKTGHGLIMEDRECEIKNETPIHNVWQKIEKEFKWYKRMDRLLSASLVYDRSGVANSATQLDTSVLDLGTQDIEDHHPINDDDVFIETNQIHHETQDWDDLHITDDISDPDPSRSSPSPTSTTLIPATPIAKSIPMVASSADRSTSKVVPQKRKTPYDQIHELTLNSQKSRRESQEKHDQSKMERNQMKENGKNKCERERLEHHEHLVMLRLEAQEQAERRCEDAEERERDRQERAEDCERAHQLLLLEKQIELERLRHAIPAAPHF
ncbi:hypothetical protein BDQ17DRAFT_1433124 [Cyathus striatus]|nr:hypothetical protein BDQ17DRAFT_1433124 [Cyathus striatus]